MNTEKTIFASNPSAMDKKQRARYSVLTKRFFAGNGELRELAGGYAFGFAANPQTIKDAAEFVTYECLCCPFLKFEIEIADEDLELRLKSKEDVKEFLKAELGIYD